MMTRVILLVLCLMVVLVVGVKPEPKGRTTHKHTLVHGSSAAATKIKSVS